MKKKCAAEKTGRREKYEEKRLEAAEAGGRGGAGRARTRARGRRPRGLWVAARAAGDGRRAGA